MNQKAKSYIKSNTLDLEHDIRMDTTGYVQYAVSEAKAYAAMIIAEEDMKTKAIEAFRCFVLRSGIKCTSEDSECYVKIFTELINS